MAVVPLDFATHFNRPVVLVSRAVRPIGSSHPLWRALTLVTTVCALALAGCRGEPTSVFVELAEARRLAADLRVQFNKASDASNRAVMADTDEASVAFAHEAERTEKLVQTDAVTLAPHLRTLGYANEGRLLEEFTRRFADYLNLDRTVLDLAVENTNLKAQGLSFGPARLAANAFRDALEDLVRVAAAKDRCHVESAVARAVLAVREAQVLQAPHIAEADDAVMGRMEAEMDHLQAVAADCVNELSGLVEPKTRLAAAWSSLERFKDVSRQIVALSRRNSNVRSLTLSLRDKPALTAACDDSLRSLNDALAKQGFRATR